MAFTLLPQIHLDLRAVASQTPGPLLSTDLEESIMATCAHCKTQETGMYESGVPICLACATDKAAKIKPVERGAAYGTMDGTGTLPKDLEKESPPSGINSQTKN